MTAPAQTPARSSIGPSLVRASGLVALGNICSRLIALATAVFTARLLTEIEFGAFGVVQGALNTFAIAASLNLGVAATRYVAVYRASDPERARSIVRVMLFLTIISTAVVAAMMTGAAPWLAGTWLRDTSVTNPLRWAALQLCAVSGFSLVLGILNGAERFARSSAMSILQNLVILLGSVLLIPKFRAIGAIGGQSIGFAFALAIGTWWIRDLLRGINWRTLHHDFVREARSLMSFAFPVLLGALFLHPFSWVCLAIISRRENGFIEVAYFSAADRCRLIILFVATFVGTALFPILSRSLASNNGDAQTAPRSLELALAGTSILLVPLSAALAFGGPQVMLAFGRSYQVNWSVLLPLIATAGAQAHLSTTGTALLAHGKQWFALLQQMFYGIGVILLTLLLPRMGIPGLGGGTGLGLAHLIITIVVLAVSLPFIKRLEALTTRATSTTIVSATLICFFCFISWWCPAGLRLVFAFPLAALAFLLSVALFTNARERRELKALAAKLFR